MRLKHPNMRPAGAPVRLRFDGAEIEALTGETIAAALAAADIVSVRQARSGAPRGPFCGMGACFDCLVTVDGRPNQRACLTKVADGMEVLVRARSPVRRPMPPAAAAEEIACDVLVVGAGPAGLSAARDLARAGANVIVADERLHAGGQFFKPLAPSQAAERQHLDRQFRDGAALHEAALQAGVRILNETTVWAAFSATDVAAIVAGRSTLFRPRRLVLATGAYEQSLPVPGWTLPGVMTVGALQTLARSYRVAPGERIVIAGNGPLVPADRGGAARRRRQRRGGAGIGVAPDRRAACPSSCRPAGPLRRCWLSGLALVSRLKPLLHWRRRVTRLLGDDRVRRVEAADLSIDADIVALGYGFSSSSELARSLGCRHHFVLRGSGSMETVTDADGRTSVPEVFAIGDGARFGGAQAAMAAGSIAAAAIARDLGLAVPEPRRARRQPGACPALPEGLVAPVRGGAAAGRRHRFGRSRLPLRGGECRRDARARCKAGHNTPAALKRATRAGMGRCQGRYCAPVIARICSGEPGEFDLFAPRPPAKPVPIRALTIEQPEWIGHVDFVPPDMARPRETETLPRRDRGHAGDRRRRRGFVRRPTGWRMRAST